MATNNSYDVELRVYRSIFTKISTLSVDLEIGYTWFFDVRNIKIVMKSSYNQELRVYMAMKNFLDKHQGVYWSNFPSISIWLNDLEIRYIRGFRNMTKVINFCFVQMS